jgi:hypothetical protein
MRVPMRIYVCRSGHRVGPPRTRKATRDPPQRDVAWRPPPCARGPPTSRSAARASGVGGLAVSPFAGHEPATMRLIGLENLTRESKVMFRLREIRYAIHVLSTTHGERSYANAVLRSAVPGVAAAWWPKTRPAIFHCGVANRSTGGLPRSRDGPGRGWSDGRQSDSGAAANAEERCMDTLRRPRARRANA